MLCTRPRCPSQAIGMLEGHFVAQCPPHALEFWEGRTAHLNEVLNAVRAKAGEATLDLDESDYEHWLHQGISSGWVEGACATHDGIPRTDAEEAEWEKGLDPCEPILRLWGPPGRAGQPSDLSL